VAIYRRKGGQGRRPLLVGGRPLLVAILAALSLFPPLLSLYAKN